MQREVGVWHHSCFHLGTMSLAHAPKPTSPWRLLAQTPGWFRMALTGAALGLGHQACALNPQPIPPEDLGIEGANSRDGGGITGGSSGSAPPRGDSGDGESSSSSGGASPGDAGFEDPDADLDAGESPDAGELDAGDAGQDPDAGEDAG